jgi:hypothetical protein
MAPGNVIAPKTNKDLGHNDGNRREDQLRRGSQNLRSEEENYILVLISNYNEQYNN